MSGAVTAIMAIKDDAQMYEMERTRMRAEPAHRYGVLPMYPEFVNKEQYSAMEHDHVIMRTNFAGHTKNWWCLVLKKPSPRPAKGRYKQ